MWQTCGMPRRYRVDVTASAARDIEAIFDYIAADNTEAAVEWIEEIERQIASLERFPLRCQAIPESVAPGQDYRQFLYGNHRTIFRVEGSKVIILRVFHSARLLDLSTLER